MKGFWWLVGINAIVLFCFGAAAITQQNTEFTYYVIVVAFLALLIGTSTRYTKIPAWLLWAASAWGWAHMAGGTVWIADTILYDAIVISLIAEPFFVLRYDQVIHLWGSFVITLIAWHTIKQFLTGPKVVQALIVFAIGLGLGSINEVIEFCMVLFIEQTYVGDYFNIALDLAANVIGASIAALTTYLREDT